MGHLSPPLREQQRQDRTHNTNPDELGTRTWSFGDKRLPEMLFRYRARNYPETLNTDEQARWREHCRARLIEGESGHLNFKDFYAEIEQLRTEMELDERKKMLLDEVAAFGRELESFIQS